MIVYPKKYLKVLKMTLGFEGGYSNDPNDRGGSTNYGITQGTYNAYRISIRKPKRSVKYINKEEVKDCYYGRYYKRGKCDYMPPAIATVHFDTVVNFGIYGGAKILQKTLGVKVDGKIGNITLFACKKSNPKNIAIEYCKERIKMRYILVKKRPKNKRFLRGWINRDNKMKMIIERNF